MFLDKLKSKITPNSFLHAILVLTSGTIVSQIIVFLVSPIITRLYTPSDMGLFASVAAAATILCTFGNGRYELAIALPEDNKNARALFKLSVFITVILAFAIIMIGFLPGNLLQKLLGFDSNKNNLIIVVAVLFFFPSMNNLLLRVCMRNKQFNLIAKTKVINQISISGIKIGFGFFGMGIIGLYLSTILGNIIQFFILARGVIKTVLFKRDNSPTFEEIKTIARRYKNFPLVSTWSALANTASTQLPLILFASLFSPSVAGYYSLANRVLNLPMALIGKSISDVFYERASRSAKNTDELARITLEIFKKLIFIGSLSMSIVMVYGDLLFPFVFGEEWKRAGEYSQWISVWLCFVLAASPLSVLYYVLEMQKESLLINTVMLISRIGVLYIGAFLLLDDLVIVSIFSIVGSVLWIGMCFRILSIVKVKFSTIVLYTLILPIVIFILQYSLGIYFRSLIA